jgi:tRNA-binding protein
LIFLPISSEGAEKEVEVPAPLPVTEFATFERLDIRVGRILSVDDFPEARKPLYKVTVDFGPEVGVKRSGAGLRHIRTKEELVGRLVVAVVNFPARQIGTFLSECLVLAAPAGNGDMALLIPEKEVPLGAKIF